jgi:hypothetical protein
MSATVNRIEIPSVRYSRTESARYGTIDVATSSRLLGRSGSQ